MGEIMTVSERLWSSWGAFAHPATRLIVGFVVVAFLIATLAIGVLWPRLSDKMRQDLRDRMLSWAILLPLMIGPILLGAGWTILAVGLLSLLCYQEFARATGLFREKIISLTVALGIVAVTLTALDNWYRMFLALFPLVTGALAAVAVLSDRPSGYIQRVGLGIFAWTFFGCAFGHLAFFANDERFRPLLLWLLLGVQLNDIMAYVVGKALGKHKLRPNTSPNKTIEGSLGALLLTAPIVAGLGWLIFRGTTLAHPVHLLFLGVLFSVSSQLGDLMLSSIKRDLGIKDMASTFPGHGGLLDRFTSLILAAPAVYHYVNAWVDLGHGQQIQIWSGHWGG